MQNQNEIFFKKFLNLFDNKQYKRLIFEVDMMGDIEKQNPLIVFYYASSIYLHDNSTKEDLLYASFLFEKVYSTDKKKLQPLYNIIDVSFKTKVFKQILPLVLDAYEKNNQDIKLIEGLGRIYGFLGEREKSNFFFQKLYEIDPSRTSQMALISSLNYTSGISQEEYMKECLKYAEHVEKKLDIKNDNFKFEYVKNSKIKLCFLSADFKKHSVSYFLKDLLKKIDKSSFEIILVSNLKITEQDDLTTELKKLSDSWYDVLSYPDKDLVNLLRSFNLDIIIDLNGFTEGNRFEVLARRCAKIQIGWLGYNNSLGIKNLDYLIADKNLIKRDEYNHYSEKIIFLPEIWNAFTLPKNIPDINVINKQKSKKFSFCSFNNFQKLSDRTINVWSKILKKTNTQIYLKDSSDGGQDLKNNILKKFNELDVDSKKIIFLNREKNIYDHLELYNLANVALDTFPYPGVTTSFEAILMGVPVLTMKGFNFNSRCGESIMKNINMEEMIAENDDDYIKKAILIINDENFIENNGINLRKKALISPLFDTSKFAFDFSKLIIKLCEQY